VRHPTLRTPCSMHVPPNAPPPAACTVAGGGARSALDPLHPRLPVQRAPHPQRSGKDWHQQWADGQDATPLRPSRPPCASPQTHACASQGGAATGRLTLRTCGVWGPLPGKLGSTWPTAPSTPTSTCRTTSSSMSSTCGRSGACGGEGMRMDGSWAPSMCQGQPHPGSLQAVHAAQSGCWVSPSGSTQACSPPGEHVCMQRMQRLLLGPSHSHATRLACCPLAPRMPHPPRARPTAAAAAAAAAGRGALKPCKHARLDHSLSPQLLSGRQPLLLLLRRGAAARRWAARTAAGSRQRLLLRPLPCPAAGAKARGAGGGLHVCQWIVRVRACGRAYIHTCAHARARACARACACVRAGACMHTCMRACKRLSCKHACMHMDAQWLQCRPQQCAPIDDEASPPTCVA